jgi:glycosyltransferase involved in cell wall biosynthesis
MKLSVIIPCYNEARTIEEIISLVYKAPPSDKEVIVVDDMSSDDTRKLLEGPLSSKVDKVVYHKNNKGKGAAIQTGLAHVTGDIVMIQDADMEYDPNEYQKVIAPILNNEADVVYGSRFYENQYHAQDTSYKIARLANKFLTCLSNIFTGLKLTDMETCYKAIRYDIAKTIVIKEKRFGIEPEITAKLAKVPNIRIKEVPISYAPRSYEDGKKIGYKDGIRAIYCIIKYSFSK